MKKRKARRCNSHSFHGTPTQHLCCNQSYLVEAAVAEVGVSAWASPSSWRRTLHTRLSALFLAAHPGKHNSGRYARGSTNQSAYRGEGAAQVSGGGRYLGGVEVHFVILLVSRQILVLVVAGRSHQHHPVAVLLTAGVKTHHYTVLLEDLPNNRERIKKEVKVKNHMHTYSLKQRV